MRVFDCTFGDDDSALFPRDPISKDLAESQFKKDLLQIKTLIGSPGVNPIKLCISLFSDFCC